jgi:CheY-like chemotaxis protein
MDCQMPGMDGYEATARIRSLKHASYHAIPIVAVTANAVKGDREKCLSLGMNDYISKPVHPAELNRVLSQWLKNDVGDTTMNEKVSVLELRMIEELRALDDGQGQVLKQLIEMFVEGVPGRIAAIAKAYSEGDLKTLNNEAHSLKSSAANLGAHHVSALCLKLEHAKTPEAAAALADIPAQLQEEFEKASAELRSTLG